MIIKMLIIKIMKKDNTTITMKNEQECMYAWCSDQ